jgi:leader peptidase (prepilin peptidase) / N-methyltransferase
MLLSPDANMPWAYALFICAIAVAALTQPWLWRRIMRLWQRDRRAAQLALPLSYYKRLWPWLTGISCVVLTVSALLPAYSGHANAATTLGFLALTGLCTMLCLMDWRSYWLPDSLVFALAAMGCVASFGAGLPWWMPLAGYASGYGFLWVTAWAYRTLRGAEGLGGGDIKLAGAMGAWIGPFDLPMVLAAASIVALLAGVACAWGTQSLRQIRISFGSYLAVSLGLFVTSQRFWL